MHEYRLATAGLLLTLLAACSSVPLKPLPAPVAGESGEVVIYREWAFAAGGVGLTVGVEDVGFVTLSNSEKVSAKLSPGTREVFVQARSADPTRLRVNVRKGEIVCLRTSASPSTYARAVIPVVLIVTGYHFYLDEVPCPSVSELAKYEEVSPSYETPAQSRQ